LYCQKEQKINPYQGRESSVYPPFPVKEKGKVIMKSLSKCFLGYGLLVSVSLVSSVLIMHIGATFFTFGLIPVIIAALAGGFFSGCIVNIFMRDKNSLHINTWHIPLVGTITASLPVIFIVCALNLHDELPNHSFVNKLLGQYHEKTSPLHDIIPQNYFSTKFYFRTSWR
jgi:hypothetical protein